jgi:hypothetical protein
MPDIFKRTLITTIASEICALKLRRRNYSYDRIGADMNMQAKLFISNQTMKVYR